MPTPKETLKTAIETILTQGLTYTDGNAAKEYIATELSDAIDAYTTASQPVDEWVEIRDDFFALVNYITSLASTTAATGTFRELSKRNGSPAVQNIALGSAYLSMQNLASARGAYLHGLSATRLRTGTTGNADLEIEMVAFDNGNLYVNPANDPVLHGWGALTGWAAYPGASTNGFYVRNPLTTETAFMRAVIMQAGAEVFNQATTIPFTNTALVSCKITFIWDSVNNKLTIRVQDANTTSDTVISNYSTSYASAYNATMSVGFGLWRNGSGAAMEARNMGVDYIQIKLKKQW